MTSCRYNLHPRMFCNNLFYFQSSFKERIPTIHCLYIYFHFLETFQRIFIIALSFMWVAINGTVCWTAVFLWRQVVWKERKNAPCRYSYNKNIPLFMNFINISKEIVLLIKLYNLLWKNIVSFHFFLFYSNGKSSSCIPTSKVIMSCSYGYI